MITIWTISIFHLRSKLFYIAHLTNIKQQWVAKVIAGRLPMFLVKQCTIHQKVGCETYSIHMDSTYQNYSFNDCQNIQSISISKLTMITSKFLYIQQIDRYTDDWPHVVKLMLWTSKVHRDGFWFLGLSHRSWRYKSI